MTIIIKKVLHRYKYLLESLTFSSLFLFSCNVSGSDVKFNAEMLNLGPGESIDIDRFSNAAYIQPGKYNLSWRVNNTVLPDDTFVITEDNGNASLTFLCLTPDHVDKIPLLNDAKKNLKWKNNSQCLEWNSLPGATYTVDINNQTIYIKIPKEFLEYTEENWEPASLWDDGISGALFDYNLNTRANQYRTSSNTYAAFANGVAGLNFDAWRLRGFWQGSVQHDGNADKSVDRNFKWDQIYLYRAIRSLQANLTLGETYLESDIFDSFRFTGASLRTDTNMLPPNLRDYAPEVTGLAKTNAQVEVSQYGRIIYQTQVPAGPFVINNIPSYVSGILDVTVTEQDGSQQKYQVNATSVPFLTRPGSVRYKVSTGKPLRGNHSLEDNPFVSGEVSWGVSNNWSLYSGLIGGKDYKSASVGVGRDLYNLGAIAFDMTHAQANFENESDRKGMAYRLNYSKVMSDFDAQMQFSMTKYDDEFISMSDQVYYTDAYRTKSPKALYSASINKRFSEYRISTTLGLSKRTYNDIDDDYRYDIMLSKYFDILNYKNISMSFSGYHNKSNYYSDRGAFFNISIPWGSYSSVNYNATRTDGQISHMVGVFNRVDENTNYRVNVGRSASRLTASSYINHDADNARLSGSASFSEGRYTGLAMNIQGGLTVTPQGTAIHRIGIPGNTRILVDTDGASDIPVKGYGRSSYSNYFGKAVVPEVRSYYKNKISIDMNEMPANADVIDTVDTATLTEGAIGYRKFHVNSGLKMMVYIRFADSQVPPFGAEVFNAKGYNTGIIGESGSIYLTGINPGEIMSVGRGENKLCNIHLPNDLSTVNDSMFLVCSPD